MADKTMENLLIFGGLGLAAWWAYETYFATPATTATPAVTPTPSTSAPSSTPAAQTSAPSYPVGYTPQPLTSCPPNYTLDAGNCFPNAPSTALSLNAPAGPNVTQAQVQAAVAEQVAALEAANQPFVNLLNQQFQTPTLNGLGALVRLYGR
jgi:hypothetical protein